MTLTKDQILAVPPQLKEVEIPEWGGSIFIRPVTLKEQAKLADLGVKFEKASTLDRMKNGTLCLIQWTVCDAEGQSLFAPDDVSKLLDKSASAFLRLQDEILALSGLTKESREELEKNLLPATSDRPAL
jgi:hypothetical protein